MPSSKKSLIVEQFQGTYLKSATSRFRFRAVHVAFFKVNVNFLTLIVLKLLCAVYLNFFNKKIFFM